MMGAHEIHEPEIERDHAGSAAIAHASCTAPGVSTAR
jgi:hypothetical protein